MSNHRADPSNVKRAIVGAAMTSAVAALILIIAAGMGGSAEAVDLPPAAKRMAVFNRPPVANADLPPVVQQARADLSQPSGRIGQVIPGQTRVLADGVGKNNAGIYALPTTGGRVCVVVSETTYAATCIDRFDHATGNVQWLNYSGEGVPQTAVVVAADEAEAVQVVVNGVPQDAAKERNAFFWQGDAAVSREDITRLLVRQSDGSIVKVNLAR